MAALDTARIIDGHAHLIPPRLVQAIRSRGASFGVEAGGTEAAPTIRLEGSGWTKPIPLPLTRLAERIETLDRQGIEAQVCAGWIDFTGYTMPAALGAAFAEVQNEMLALTVADHADRLAGVATVPMQDPAAAARMLERAMRDYGFRSVQIATYHGGEVFLDDPKFDPFWEAAQDLGALVCFHPYDEKFPPGTADYFLHNVVNYPLQSAIAISRMIFGGVFDRFPTMKCCFPHGGGYLPYQFGRIRRAAIVRPEPKARGFSGDPLDRLKTLWFDTVTHNPASLRYLAEMVGAERMVMGSDYPFDMNDPDPVGSVKAGLPENAWASAMGGNARMLMGYT